MNFKLIRVSIFRLIFAVSMFFQSNADSITTNQDQIKVSRSMSKANTPSLINAVSTPSPISLNTNSAIGTKIVNGLVSSLIPGAASSSSSGAIGASPLSKLTGPLSHLISSNGKGAAEDVDQLLKALPDLAVMLGMANMFSGGAGDQSLANLDLSKVPPELIQHVANGGQIPGISAADLQMLTQRFMQQKSGSVQSNSSQSIQSNITTWTPDQVADMISGKIPLPPISSLPPDYVATVMNGGSLPGLTIDQTQALKQRYMQQMFNGDGFSMTSGQQQSIPVIGNVSLFVNTTTNSKGNENALSELKKLDLSQLPPDLVQSFLSGKTPDLSKIPQSFLRSLIESPQIFADLVSAELQKKIANDSNDNKGSEKVSVSSKTSSKMARLRGSAAYDVNSLDKMADISMYKQNEDNDKATLWTSIVLGCVGFGTVVLIGVLCWRRRQSRKVQNRDIVTALNAETATATNSSPIRLNPFLHSSVPNEILREVDDAEVGMNSATNRGSGQSIDNLRGDPEAQSQRAAYTQQWVASNQIIHNDRGPQT